MDTRNDLVTLENTHVKPYNYPTKDTIINNPEKTANKKIPMPFDHLETEKPC